MYVACHGNPDLGARRALCTFNFQHGKMHACTEYVASSKKEKQKS